MPFFRRENIDFYYEEYGSGPAFVFSHGLGSNLAQVRELMGDLPGVRVILYDNRGHGRTSGIGDPSRLTFPVMAEDMAALLDHLAVPAAAVGGVSMGAGISMAFCLKYPARTKALVLSRPAWLNSPEPENLKILQMIADLVEKYGPEPALEHFRRSERFADFERVAPATAKTTGRVVYQPWRGGHHQDVPIHSSLGAISFLGRVAQHSGSGVGSCQPE